MGWASEAHVTSAATGCTNRVQLTVRAVVRAYPTHR
jgi:hypothetical protein